MTLKILVVDDEPQIRRQLKVGLNGYGYDVLTATNGEEALITAAQQQPDLLILDISLGSAPDGIEVCRRLREWSATPVIMLSIRDEEQRRQHPYRPVEREQPDGDQKEDDGEQVGLGDEASESRTLVRIEVLVVAN